MDLLKVKQVMSTYYNLMLRGEFRKFSVHGFEASQIELGLESEVTD
jgi:hypothetical protein